MEFDKIKEAYKNLASAAGVEFDEENVEVYLKHLIDECIALSFKEAGVKVNSLQASVSTLKGEIKRGKEANKEFKQDCDIVLIREKRNFESECDAIVKEKLEPLRQFTPDENANPFHNAVEDFLNQLEAHNFSSETKGAPLAAFINSMGYLYWQNNDKDKTGKSGYGVERRI